MLSFLSVDLFILFFYTTYKIMLRVYINTIHKILFFFLGAKN